MELEGKEKDILKSGAGGGAESRKERKELQKANHAMKSAIHNKLVTKTKEHYELEN